MRVKLTDGAIKALATDGTRATVRDAELVGFALRLSQGGKKSFVYEYRPRGAGRSVSPTTLTVGSWPALKAEAARRLVQGYVVDVARGGDPAQDRRAQSARRATALKALLAEEGPYERALKRRKLVNWRVALSSLRRELGPLMGQDAASLTRADYVQRITSLQDADKPGAAADLRKFAYSFIEWCVQQGHAQHNVLAGWKQPPKTRAERLAKLGVGRALSDQEIIKLWRAADATDGTPFGALVQLSLLTALRRGEAAGLRWQDITVDRIVLSPETTKTGRGHAVPLTPLMRSVIAAQPKTTSERVFPSPVTGEPINGWTKLVARLQQSSGVDFRLHDMRRTCRTLMSRLNIPEDDAELAIGHQRADLVARYNRDDAWERRAAAFIAVSAHIAALIGNAQSPVKIIPLPTR